MRDALLAWLRRRWPPDWRSLPRPSALTLLLLVMGVASTLPLLSVRHPPLQDLPQHLAAVRVLSNYHDPALGFDRYLDIALGRTQYLSYYLVVVALSKVFGVIWANKLVLGFALVVTPPSLAALLRAVDRDPIWALACLPLTYNAHLILGFLNFVAALPLALFGLTLAIRQRETPTRRRAWGLGILAVVLFYTHVVPFALFFLGAVLVSIDTDWRATLRRSIALVPSVIAALVWLAASPAGGSVLAALGDASHGVSGRAPAFATFGQNLKEVYTWLLDVFPEDADDELLVCWVVAVGAAFAAGAGRVRAPRDDAMGARIGVLFPVCIIGYFATPTSYDWIWPINARFPILALVFAIVLLPNLSPLVRRLFAAAFCAVALVSFHQALTAFRGFEGEISGLDESIAVIPPGQKVAGLIWDRNSRFVRYSPFLHSVAWYQAERGGAVMFSFADFPESPVVFKSDNRPPRVVPRWEWMPERVNPDRDLDWFDYVLTRGGPGRIARSVAWQRIYSNKAWSVWSRRSKALPSAADEP
jgi:hypothetical protein